MQNGDCCRTRAHSDYTPLDFSSFSHAPDLVRNLRAIACTPLLMTQCWCGGADITTTYDRHGAGVCDDPCTGDSSLTCGGTFAFQIYPFPASAAPTPAPTTLAPTHAPTPLILERGGGVLGSATMSYQDLLNAIAGGGDTSLILTDAVTNQVVGTLDFTVTTVRRRQMMEAIDGQQGIRGDNRDLQASSTVSVCFQNPRVGARKNMALWWRSHTLVGHPHTSAQTCLIGTTVDHIICTSGKMRREPLGTRNRPPCTCITFDIFIRCRSHQPSLADETTPLSSDPHLL